MYRAVTEKGCFIKIGVPLLPHRHCPRACNGTIQHGSPYYFLRPPFFPMQGTALAMARPTTSSDRASCLPPRCPLHTGNRARCGGRSQATLVPWSPSSKQPVAASASVPPRLRAYRGCLSGRLDCRWQSWSRVRWALRLAAVDLLTGRAGHITPFVAAQNGLVPPSAGAVCPQNPHDCHSRGLYDLLRVHRLL
jgi:hypothetical protein